MLIAKENKMIRKVMMAVLTMGLLVIGANQAAAQRQIADSEWQWTTTLPQKAVPTGDIYVIAAEENSNIVFTTHDHAAGTAPGTTVGFWEWGAGYPNTKAQQWFIVPTEDSVDFVWEGAKYQQYYIIGRASGLTLHKDSTIDVGFDIDRKWVFVPAGNGSFYIKSVCCSNQAFTRYGSALGNGTQLKLNWYDQKMKFRLKKATEFRYPANPNTPVGRENLDRVPLKIGWQNGNPVFPDACTDTNKTCKAFATSFTYMPGFLVNDPGMIPVDKYDSTPYYKLQKESLPFEVIQYDNSDGEADARPNYSYSSGISESESNSRTETFSISATVGTGEKSPIQASVTVGYESAWTTERSTGSERGTGGGAEFDVKPGYAAALYAIQYRFTVLRLDGTKVKSWEVYGPGKFKNAASCKPGSKFCDSGSEAKAPNVINTSPPPVNTTSTGNAPSVEQEFWDAVKNSRRRQDFQSYLDNYPNGRFVALARLKMDQLQL